MKISKQNTNLKNQPIDSLVKSKIELLNLYPPPSESWNKNSAWNVIKSKLQGSNKIITTWGISIAASISLLIAAGLTFDIYFPVFQENEEEIATVRASNDKSRINSGKSKILRSKAEINISNSIVPLLEPKPIEIRDNRLSTSKKLNFSHNRKSVTMDYRDNYKSILLPYISLHHSITNGSLPNIGFDLRILSKDRNGIRHNFNLGVSASFSSVESEKMKKNHLFTFANLSYDRVNKATQKGWNARAAYMINPDSNVYKKNTIKLSLNRSFNRHIKAGPEFIFTNNFKKVYPGISIVFS